MAKANTLVHKNDVNPPDRLGRQELAESIAIEIQNSPTNTLRVFGIEGKWGAGKTYLADRIVERLNPSDWIVVKLSAWGLSDRGDITNAFYQDVANLLPKKLSDKLARPLSMLLLKLTKSSKDVTHTELEKLIFNSVFFLYSILGINGLQHLFSTATKLIAIAIMALLFLSRSFLWLASSVLRFFSPKSTEDEINSLLSNGDKRLLIIIDDLDRLPPNDIYSVLRVLGPSPLKANSTMLVCYERQFVNEAIRTVIQQERGADVYLDKVLFNEFSLNLIPRPKLYAAFREEWEKVNFSIIGRMAPSTPDRDDPIQKAEYTICPMLENLRDIERIIAAYDFIAKRTTYLNNPALDLHDIMVICALKIKHRSVYEDLMDGLSLHFRDATMLERMPIDNSDPTREPLTKLLKDHSANHAVGYPLGQLLETLQQHEETRKRLPFRIASEQGFQIFSEYENGKEPIQARLAYEAIQDGEKSVDEIVDDAEGKNYVNEFADLIRTKAKEIQLSKRQLLASRFVSMAADLRRSNNEGVDVSRTYTWLLWSVEDLVLSDDDIQLWIRDYVNENEGPEWLRVFSDYYEKWDRSGVRKNSIEGTAAEEKIITAFEDLFESESAFEIDLLWYLYRWSHLVGIERVKAWFRRKIESKLTAAKVFRAAFASDMAARLEGKGTTNSINNIREWLELPADLELAKQSDSGFTSREVAYLEKIISEKEWD